MKLSLALNTLFGDQGDNLSVGLSLRKQRKIKHRLKELSNHLSNYGLISLKWAQFPYFEGLLLVFRHGTISSVCFTAEGTISSVYHENYLHDKLPSNRVSSIEIDDTFIVISYIEPCFTVISLEKNFHPNKRYLKFKLKNSSCAIRTVNLGRSQSRQVLSKRNISLNLETGHLILWWNTAPFPNWALPVDNSRTPNLIFMEQKSLNVLATETIDGEIIKISFVKHEPSNVGLIYRPSNSSFTLNYLLFEITSSTEPSLKKGNSREGGKREKEETTKGELVIIFNATIPLDKSCIHVEFTRLQDKILLLCDDESVMLFNIEQNVLYSLHSSLPVCYLASNPLDAIFATCNQYGVVSLYDFAFNNLSFDVVAKNSSKSCLTQNGDIGLISSGMTIKRLQFLTPQLLALLLVDNMRQEARGSMSLGSTSPSVRRRSPCQLVLLTLAQRVDFKFLTHEYLHACKYEEALRLLQSLNWNCSFEQAYYCLHAIFQFFLKLPLDSELESKIESTLAAFLIPCTPIDYKIFEQILPYIRHLAIRFFFHLIRHESYAKAYQLGVELKSRRHFLLLYQITKQKGLYDLMRISYRQAQQLT